MKAHAGVFVLALALAAAAPLFPRASTPARASVAFPGWPATFDGAALTRLPAGREDVWFTRDFPGRVARFAAQDRQVVIRWVSSPTRRLHPASHCFTGAGYAVSPAPMKKSGDGALMSCFHARRGIESLEVCEQLRDSNGASWPDVSAWYWHALTAPAGRAWWSYVVVAREIAPAGGPGS
ncbi:MAG TPA: hypothetical protein VMF52_18310 [Steroidobacteraceae bacterium]|nr:hypothetical protein [Steroidobacteraceae bacterium]